MSTLAEAVAKARADAEDGVAAASNLLATLAAAGVGMAQSWPDALTHLARAASDGSTAARGQLETLGHSGGEGPDRWERLTASVDIQSWLAPVERRALCDAPRIVAIDGFLPLPVLSWLIGLAHGRVRPAPVYSASGAATIEGSARDNAFIEFGVLNSDVVLQLVRARIASTLSVPLGALENTQVLHYDVGQTFRPHHDFVDPTLPEVGTRGQRIATFLVYLNDDFDGGETEFPTLNLRHKGRAGDAVFFVNADPAGSPDPRTLHAGLPPIRGEKWLLSQWIRNRARQT